MNVDLAALQKELTAAKRNLDSTGLALAHAANANDSARTAYDNAQRSFEVGIEAFLATVSKDD
jgi:hypothetical protein